MAKVIAGIGGSHTPSVARAFYSDDQKMGEWRSYFQTYDQIKSWLKEKQVDLAIVFYNDHMVSLQFDQYPTFAVGASESFPVAEEMAPGVSYPNVPGDLDFSWHLAETLIDDDIDPTMCQVLPIDHGVMTVLPMLFDTPWPIPIVPIAINVIQHPLPRPSRCYRLGQSIRRAIENDGTDRRVVVIGTGGLSHQLQGKRMGFVDQKWDEEFMDLIEKDPEKLSQMSIAEFQERGGSEGTEVIIWLAMRGALGKSPRRTFRSYHPGLLTGCGVLALEDV